MENSMLWSNNKVLMDIVQSAPLAIIVLDRDGLVQIWNKGAQSIFGWKETEVLNQFYPIIPDDQKEQYKMNIQNLTLNDQITTYEETKRLTKSGEKITVRINAAPVVINDMFSGLIILAEDLTENKKSEGILKETVAELKGIRTSLDESSLVTITDPRGVIKYVNDKFCNLYKYKKEELIGHDHRIVNSKYHDKKFFKNLWRILGSGEIFRGEIRNQAKDGKIIWSDVTIVPFINELGKPYQYISIAKDITSRKQAESELLFIAYYDELTKLPNKRKFIEVIQEKANNNTPFSVLYLSLDRFKMVNDIYGHEVGDLLLISFAERLKAIVNKTSLIARKDSDHFMIIVEDVNKEALKKCVLNLIEKVSNPFLIKDNNIYTSISVGICLYPIDNNDPQEILKKAEMSMYHAKKVRKGKYFFYDKEIEEQIKRKIRIEKYLRNAIENNELEIHYQPRINIIEDKVVGMEALLRWNNKVLGAVNPAEFIPIAEETGLIIPIGKWVLDEACKQASEWAAKYEPLRISVNISAYQLQEPDIVEIIENVLDKTNLKPNWLEIEITENIALENKSIVFNKLQTLKDIGINISIDDFGTGYSSLSYLRDFPIHCLKIDRSFIQDINEDGDASIIRMIIAMAKSLNLYVTAEGIETSTHLRFLKEQLCNEAQGFYFSKPLSKIDFETKILNQLQMQENQ